MGKDAEAARQPLRGRRRRGELRAGQRCSAVADVDRPGDVSRGIRAEVQRQVRKFVLGAQPPQGNMALDPVADFRSRRESLHPFRFIGRPRRDAVGSDAGRAPFESQGLGKQFHAGLRGADVGLVSKRHGRVVGGNVENRRAGLAQE